MRPMSPMPRHTTIALAAGLGLVACAAENQLTAPPPPVDWQSLAAPPTPPAPTAPRLTDQERTIAQHYLAALSSPHCEKLTPLLDEAAHFWFAGRETLGPAAVLGQHADIFGAFAQRQFKATRLLLAASAQAIEWTMTGTQIGPWQGLPASEKPWSSGSIPCWHIGRGSITDIRMYFDQAVVKAQLGLGPADSLALPPATVSDVPPLVVEQPTSDHAATNAGVMRNDVGGPRGHEGIGLLGTFADDIQVFTQDRALADYRESRRHAATTEPCTRRFGSSTR